MTSSTEAEIELRAQVDRALAMGVRPTHLDSHQNRLYQTGAPLFEAFRRVARSYGIPMLLPRAVASLPPGVTEFVIHLADDDDEMRAFSRDRPTWGAAWRQRDFDYFTSDSFREKLRLRGAVLVTWRDIAARLRSPAARAPQAP